VITFVDVAVSVRCQAGHRQAGHDSRTADRREVALSSAAGQVVSVGYATADGTATAPSDYTAANGTLSFKPGEKTKTIVVSVAADLAYEPDETLTLTLSNPVNATIASGSATGTITNDDTIARVGHYLGTTSQNERFEFDVTPDGAGVTGLRTGQINQSCEPPAYISHGDLDFGDYTVPVATDGSFKIDVTYKGLLQAGSETSETDTHVVITGRFSGTAPARRPGP
jgi:hypothetical protein